jgi:shikimate kinase
METEQLTAAELDAHVQEGNFRLAFVGMSNGGKSYRSKVLKRDLDFYWYEVDAHIQAALGHEDMDDISSWLDFPTSPTHAERAAQYLAAEERCTHLSELDTEGKNLVFDTTGSVIYLSDVAKEWLHDQCLIVHIDVGEGQIPELTRRYFEEPKPVLWGDSFNQQDGEEDRAALERCYPELLRDRLVKYRDLAHVSIPLEELFDTSGEETLAVIKSHL